MIDALFRLLYYRHFRMGYDALLIIHCGSPISAISTIRAIEYDQVACSKKHKKNSYISSTWLE